MKVILGGCSLGSTQDFDPEKMNKVPFSGTPYRAILMSGGIRGNSKVVFMRLVAIWSANKLTYSVPISR